jgi:hypothetical protein
VSVKEDILTTLKGGRPQRVSWNIHHHLMPQGSLEYEMRERRLGIIEKSVFPYQLASSHVTVEERVVWEDDRRTSYITFRTPIGELHNKRVIGPDGSIWVREYPVKGPADMAVLAYISEDAEYRPNDEAVSTRQRSLGEDGLVLCRLMRSPIQRLLTEWMGTEAVAYALADYPQATESLLARLAASDEPALRLAAASPAEAVWSSENITADITTPMLFRRYCLPYYNHAASLLHEGGKLYGVHMDGKLSALKQAVAESTLDFVEGFTPPPMGDLSLSEARRAWPGKALWVNFPGSVLHGSSEEVLSFTEELLHGGMKEGGFLLTFTEDFPDPGRSLRLVAEGIGRYEKSAVPADRWKK